MTTEFEVKVKSGQFPYDNKKVKGIFITIKKYNRKYIYFIFLNKTTWRHYIKAQTIDRWELVIIPLNNKEDNAMIIDQDIFFENIIKSLAYVFAKLYYKDFPKNFIYSFQIDRSYINKYEMYKILKVSILILLFISGLSLYLLATTYQPSLLLCFLFSISLVTYWITILYKQFL